MVEETEFTKLLGSHKNYLECNAIVNYLDLSKQGKSMHEILDIIEKEKIPEYVKHIEAEARKCQSKNSSILPKIEKLIGLYF